MKLSKIIGYSLTAVVVLGVLGWVPLVSTSITPPTIHIDAKCQTDNPHPCKCDPASVCVNINTPVSWAPPPNSNHIYHADFGPKAPYNTGTTSVLAGTSGPKITGGTACPNPKTECDPTCYFHYDVIKDTLPSPQCSDPGVRVVPPSKVSFVRWLYHLVFTHA